MARLNKERQDELEPKRMEFAKNQIERLGYDVQIIDTSVLQFNFNGSIITFYPYSGWATGKTITDGRGIDNLLRQIRQ